MAMHHGAGCARIASLLLFCGAFALSLQWMSRCSRGR
jgi:hypothetical protein